MANLQPINNDLEATPARLRPRDVPLVAAWCGVAGGLLEVATRVFCLWLDPTNRLSMLSRHYLWLTPLSTLFLLLAAGIPLAFFARLAPRRGPGLALRFVAFCAIFPALVIVSSRIYPLAWAILALGLTSVAARFVESDWHRVRRALVRSFPALLAVVGLLAGSVIGSDWLARHREERRPVPPAGSPNVLLIVLDTVRADRLSVYGYDRKTTPVLERLAGFGIRFENARATAPWTLPSHASLFTGQLPHELGARWRTPLNSTVLTLAEYLGNRGYSTAGFVANTLYCSRETGLDRGFTHYEDYILQGLMPLRTAWLGDHFFQAISDFGVFVAQKFEIGPFRAAEQSFFASQFIVDPRKDAASINRAFLDWLNARKQPSRPFFAFLNFYDAHAPYMLPAGARYRFGLTPRKPADFEFLVDGWDTVDRLELRPIYRQLASDSYDNCLAYLDERLGELLEELRLRGVLDQTLVIVTADHGEGFGEHGLFDHGESLYRSEVRVPLLIVLPAGRRFTGSVPQPVSLLDVPATIVDVVGTAERSPFAGHSLAEFWNRQTPLARRSSSPREAFSELPSPNPYNPNRGRSPAQNGPLTALASDDYVYIRNDGDGSEELFDARQDPAEAHNLARTGAVADVLTRLRDRLERMKKGGK